MSKPTISILVITFNQKMYIQDTIQGILNQNTKYNYEVIVHDDASTDGTTDILRSYAKRDNRIKLIVQEKNLYQNPSIDYLRDFLIPAASGDFLAVCEGDDYWDDPNKLDMQVQYLIDHPECNMVCSRARVIDGEDGSELGFFGYGKNDCDLSVGDLLERWQVPTASCVFRRPVAIAYYAEWNFRKPVGDFPRAIYMAAAGGLHYFGLCTSVYRYSVPGSWTTAVKHSPSKKDKEAREWLSMLENMDKRLDGKFHSQFIRHAGQYAVMARIYGRAAPNGSFYQEAITALSFKEKLKYIVLKILAAFGLQIVKTRWSGLMKWKVEKL